jgi:hypothetical protein
VYSHPQGRVIAHGASVAARTRVEAPLHEIRSRLLGVVVAISTIGCGTATTPSPTPAPKSDVPAASRSPQESWYALYLRGAKIGHAHTRLTHFAEGGRDLVREQTAYEFAIGRGADVARTSLTYDGVETVDGRLIQFTQVVNAGRAPTPITGRTDGNLLIVKSTTLGKTTVHKFDVAAPLAGPNTWQRMLGAQPLPANRTIRMRSFEPAVLEVMDETIVAAVPGRLDAILGKDQGLHQLTRVQRRPSGAELRYTVWVDRTGVCMKTRDETLGLESHRVSREQALETATGPSLNLLTDTSVRLVGDLPKGRDTKRAVFNIASSSQPVAELFAVDSWQSVRKIGKQTVLEVGKSTDFHEPPPTPQDRQPSPLIQSDDVRVISLAEKAAGTATAPETVVAALERYVHANMKHVNFTQAFASAAEVAEHLEGDCSEHAVLLCAMLRARGLPARVAAGLIYQPHSRTFAYHMWTEAWIAEGERGRWKPLDATTPNGVHRALYLKIAATNLKSGLADPAFLQVAKVLGSDLTIEAVESE